MIDNIVSGIISFVMGLVVMLKDVVSGNPVIGIGLVAIILVFVYMTSHFIINGTYTITQLFMYLFILAAIIIVVYIMWTSAGIGGNIGDWLMGIFGKSI